MPLTNSIQKRTASCFLAALGASLFAVGARASDGVIEINQASALAGAVTPGDGAGFPVTLTKAASYRLTSRLDVPASTDGVVISVAGATLDLNGFAIESTYQCCASGGSGSGVLASAGRTTLVNGEVSSFGDRGIDLGANSQVERVVVRNIGAHGITLGSASIALANRVSNIGQSGLRFTGAEPGALRDNSLTDTAQRTGSTARALEGVARATGGNYCADRSCSPRGTRRYYLSAATFEGGAADTSCEPGFRMASVTDLFDFGVLEYFTLPGLVAGDSGRGAPIFRAGWVRVGESGTSNCQDWTSGSSVAGGTLVGFNFSGLVTGAGAPPPPLQPPFAFTFDSCDSSRSVWCIEE